MVVNIEKPILPLKPRLIHQRVVWSFKDNQHNPLMGAAIKSGECRARLTDSAMEIIRTGEKHEEWRVGLDSEGFVLRQNGRRHLAEGRPVNALYLDKNPRAKSYLSFWELVFQRDRAPIEGRTEMGFDEFNLALRSLWFDEDKALLSRFCRAKVGPRGEIPLLFNSRHQSFLWALTLMRHHAGRDVLIAPLETNGEFSLGVYGFENLKWHGTFHFDADLFMFYTRRAKRGDVYREYFLSVPPRRQSQFNGYDLFFNQKARYGDVYVLEADGQYSLRRGDQSIYMPLFEIKNGGAVIGYLVGDMWPQHKIDISGRVCRGARIHWDGTNRMNFFRVLGKIYRLSIEDAAHLGIKDHDDVFLTFENGHVVAVEGKIPGRIAYYHLARDKNWKVLTSSRTVIDNKILKKDGVVILEGLECVQTNGWAGVLVGGGFLTFGIKYNSFFKKRQASVVILIKNGKKCLLYDASTPRFGVKDREKIREMIKAENLDLTLIRHINRRRRANLFEKMKGIFTNNGAESLQTRLELLRNIMIEESLLATDVFHMLDLIMFAAMNNPEAANVLEVFSKLHLVLTQMPKKQTLVCAGLALLMAHKETRGWLMIVFRNCRTHGRLAQLRDLLDHQEGLAAEVSAELALMS